MPLYLALAKERAQGFISVIQNRSVHSIDLAELWVVIIITQYYIFIRLFCPLSLPLTSRGSCPCVSDS